MVNSLARPSRVCAGAIASRRSLQWRIVLSSMGELNVPSASLRQPPTLHASNLSLLFPGAAVPDFADIIFFQAKTMLWKCDALNCTATTTNLLCTSHHEMYYGTPPRAKMLVILESGFYRPVRAMEKDEPHTVP